MNKWTLVCAIPLLVATSQLLMAESNTIDAPEENGWTSEEAPIPREETDLSQRDEIHRSDVGELHNSNGEETPHSSSEEMRYSEMQEMRYSDREEVKLSMQESYCCSREPCCPEKEPYCCAGEPCCCDPAPSFFSKLDPTLKVRIAAFLPTSERFHKIYGSTLPIYQIEAGGTFLECYQAWINIDWMDKRGKSEHLHYHTRVEILNVSLGVGITHQLTCSISAYAGIGPSFGSVFVHNRHTHLHKKETKFIAGLVVKSGLIYQINCRFFVDLFIDYLYQPSNFRTHVNVGGLKAGIGVGTHF